MSRHYGMENLPSPATITPGCRLSIGAGIARIGGGLLSSGASPWSDAANSLLACPFVLETETKFFKGFWVNGASAGGNSEVGIWDENYAKLTTTGSTGGTGNNVPQAVALSPQPTLSPGLYYMGIAHSATTTGQLNRWSCGFAGFWQAMGCWRQAGITLGSLASTATPGDMSNVAFPAFGLITRSVFDA